MGMSRFRILVNKSEKTLVANNNYALAA